MLSNKDKRNNVSNNVKAKSLSCTFDSAKKLIKTSKDRNLIKPHTEAFVSNPTSLEVHKGNVKYFCN